MKDWGNDATGSHLPHNFHLPVLLLNWSGGQEMSQMSYLWSLTLALHTHASMPISSHFCLMYMAFIVSSLISFVLLYKSSLLFSNLAHSSFCFFQTTLRALYNFHIQKDDSKCSLFLIDHTLIFQFSTISTKT